MIASPLLGWTFTVLFAATGVVTLVGAIRSRTWTDRGSYAAHVLMSIAMAIMPWSWSMAVPAIVQIVVFTAAALWYVALLLFAVDAHPGPDTVHHHGGGMLVGYHAVMMAGMVWMAALMSMMMGTDISGSAEHDMSGTTGMGDMSTTGSGDDLWAQPTWAVVVTLVFVLVFAVAAVVFFIELLRLPSSRRGAAPLSPLTGTLVNLAMSAGMGGAFLLMS